MEKKIENYLHLYLWCECEWQHHADTGRGIIEESDISNLKKIVYIKPILRPLSNMTVEEICTIFNETFVPSFATDNIKALSGSLFGLHNFLSKYGNFDSIPELLKLGFDLFGLIDAGIAIDSTTLKPIKQ